MDGARNFSETKPLVQREDGEGEKRKRQVSGVGGEFGLFGIHGQSARYYYGVGRLPRDRDRVAPEAGIAKWRGRSVEQLVVGLTPSGVNVDRRAGLCE